ncbi:hypothetical protein DAI22_11g106400 [Oryza sativa Japonica Group]|nr:hypothetical protein DAI22_11g106400 [Oryza sativa Japonica Group]
MSQISTPKRIKIQEKSTALINRHANAICWTILLQVRSAFNLIKSSKRATREKGRTSIRSYAHMYDESDGATKGNTCMETDLILIIIESNDLMSRL